MGLIRQKLTFKIIKTYPWVADNTFNETLVDDTLATVADRGISGEGDDWSEPRSGEFPGGQGRSSLRGYKGQSPLLGSEGRSFPEVDDI